MSAFVIPIFTDSIPNPNFPNSIPNPNFSNSIPNLNFVKTQTQILITNFPNAIPKSEISIWIPVPILNFGIGILSEFKSRMPVYAYKMEKICIIETQKSN